MHSPRYSFGIPNIVTNSLVLAVPIPLLRASLTHWQNVDVYILYLSGSLYLPCVLLLLSVPQAISWS
ncbi:hypothetical protein EV426DRAFT_580566 [Tirmania nivea]|nr:hypothetical protein EV426DRAFT_580566 [Tirmania nivea]